jgi:hypothetical protein
MWKIFIVLEIRALESSYSADKEELEYIEGLDHNCVVSDRQAVVSLNGS